MTEDDCVLEFNIRKKEQTMYPGACALQYQDFIDIFIRDILQWDHQKQRAKRAGVMGTVKAFGPADEEQGRGSLHSHWQTWIKELNQDLRDALFESNKKKEREDEKSSFASLNS